MHRTIGEHLLQLLAERQLTAAKLAKMAHVKPSYLYDIIHGKSKNPSIIKLAQIANALQVNISELLGDQSSVAAPAIPHRRRKKWTPESVGNAYTSITHITMENLGGAVITRESKQTPYLFSRSLIQCHLGLDPQDLRMVYMRGDGMKPELSPDDVILVDITRKYPSPPGIFVLFDGFTLIAKRLEILPNTTPPTMRVISANGHYASYECPVGELNIIGRVIWFARML